MANESYHLINFEPLSENDPNINFNMNPNDISAIRIACQACPSAGVQENFPENFGKDVRTDIDHIIFTSNSSLLDQ